jgi:hypothetical protein
MEVTGPSVRDLVRLPQWGVREIAIRGARKRRRGRRGYP